MQSQRHFRPQAEFEAEGFAVLGAGGGGGVKKQPKVVTRSAHVIADPASNLWLRRLARTMPSRHRQAIVGAVMGK